ncbi:hypothetical protein HMPREF1137_0610 [Actinomyces sp. ICM39]|nr:hypothetical protein HMPREF1137_0610 [Actinomyces sp. ICM39]
MARVRHRRDRHPGLRNIGRRVGRVLGVARSRRRRRNPRRVRGRGHRALIRVVLPLRHCSSPTLFRTDGMPPTRSNTRPMAHRSR